MAANDYCLVISSIDDPARAAAIADKAVEKRLASGVNTINGVHSVYRWKGAIEKAEELVLIFYTRASLVESLSALIKELHPYELPAILAVDIAKGLPDFLSWIGSNTASHVEDY
ncbi:divalent-cation tolerance protein CutA [Planctomycetota bacterium]